MIYDASPRPVRCQPPWRKSVRTEDALCSTVAEDSVQPTWSRAERGIAGRLSMAMAWRGSRESGISAAVQRLFVPAHIWFMTPPRICVAMTRRLEGVDDVRKVRIECSGPGKAVGDFRIDTKAHLLPTTSIQLTEAMGNSANATTPAESRGRQDCSPQLPHYGSAVAKEPDACMIQGSQAEAPVGKNLTETVGSWAELHEDPSRLSNGCPDGRAVFARLARDSAWGYPV